MLTSSHPRAADAMTDVIFNAGSIAFPIGMSSPLHVRCAHSSSSPFQADKQTNILVGFYAGIWWLDALGGLLLSMVVIINWSRTSVEHIKHLSGFSATADQRNICELFSPLLSLSLSR